MDQALIQLPTIQKFPAQITDILHSFDFNLHDSALSKNSKKQISNYNRTVISITNVMSLLIVRK